MESQTHKHVNDVEPDIPQASDNLDDMSNIGDNIDAGGYGEEEDEYEDVWVEETIVVPAVNPTQKEIDAAALFGQDIPAPKPATTRTVRKLERRKKEKRTAPAPTNAASNAGVGGLDDMFGSPSPAPSSFNSGNSGGGDDFMDLLGGGSSSGSGGGFDYANIQPTPTVARAIAGNRVPVSTTALAGHDDKVYISYVKARKDKNLMLAIFCSNTTSETISDFIISFNVNASDIKVLYAGEPRPVVQGNTARFVLPANGHSTLMAQVTLASPSGMFATRLPGKISYASGSQSFNFEVPTDMSDWMRQLQLTVQEFGGKWTSAQMKEKRCTLGRSFSTTQALLNAIVKGGLALKIVQARASEGILSGTVAGTPIVILVHAKIGSSTNITVKTQVPVLSDRIVKAIEASLS
jgi:hypothetical protein